MIKLISITVSNKENCLSKKILRFIFSKFSLNLLEKPQMANEWQKFKVPFCEHDCDNSTTRSSSGTSNLLFSGHDNGVIQMWDLQTAGVVFKKGHGKGQESNASLNGHEIHRNSHDGWSNHFSSSKNPNRFCI